MLFFVFMFIENNLRWGIRFIIFGVIICLRVFRGWFKVNIIFLVVSLRVCIEVL